MKIYGKEVKLVNAETKRLEQTENEALVDLGCSAAFWEFMS
jgi:hypothetical protein